MGTLDSPGTPGQEGPTIDENGPLEEALVIIQAELSKTLDARLKTLEAKQDMTLAIAAKVDEMHGMITSAVQGLSELMENPMVQSLISSASGFPGFGG